MQLQNNGKVSYIDFQEHLFQSVDLVIEHIVIHEVRLPAILNIILDTIFDILDLEEEKKLILQCCSLGFQNIIHRLM